MTKQIPTKYKRNEDSIESINTFAITAAVDQPVGYYGMHLVKFLREICTICSPWREYVCICPSQGMLISSGVFHKNFVSNMENIIKYNFDYIIMN
mmetsp:Transcript_984/g.1475  ORF Transcript_984/g.1475 Transcript_984/m.1475 type:complete len:95 (+) Transcript_984:1309-1593(+)